MEEEKQTCQHQGNYFCTLWICQVAHSVHSLCRHSDTKGHFEKALSSNSTCSPTAKFVEWKPRFRLTLRFWYFWCLQMWLKFFTSLVCPRWIVSEIWLESDWHARHSRRVAWTSWSVWRNIFLELCLKFFKTHFFIYCLLGGLMCHSMNVEGREQLGVNVG